MKIIAVGNYKGGSGKTTTAVNLAYDLAVLKEKRVLLIDADPQGHASYMLWKYNPNALTLRNVLLDDKPIKRAIRKSRFKNIDILPATEVLEAVNSHMTELEELTELRDALKPLVEEDAYDICIIDCQPTMQPLTLNVLVAADLLLIPIEAYAFAMNGMKIMMGFMDDMQKIRGQELPYAGVVVKYHESQKNLDKIMNLIERDGYIVLDSVITYSMACCTSQDARKPLLCHRKNSKATKDYISLMEELLREYIDA